MLLLLPATVLIVGLSTSERCESRRARGAAEPVLALRGGFGNPLGIAAAKYTAMLAAAPTATNVVTAGALSALSDGIAQSLTSEPEAPWDYQRSAWIVLWGTVVSGFGMSRWFRFLGSLFPDARTSLSAFALKLLTNQIVLSPGLNGCFFAFVILTRQAPVARMTREKWGALRSKLRTDLLPCGPAHRTRAVPPNLTPSFPTPACRLLSHGATRSIRFLAAHACVQRPTG